MTRHQLSVSFDFDFVLIGIVSNIRDYRLCYAINKALGLDLQKQDNLELLINKRTESSHYSVYLYENEDSEIFRLISNRGTKGFLIPEQKQIDYLFMVHSGLDFSISECIKQLKTILFVQGAYQLDVHKLKSKEHLVF
jgi:hypothetical protein